MCGIAGILSWSDPPSIPVLQRMLKTLQHRGPDASGSWAEGPIALAHQRLSIVDLDPRSNQPFVDCSGRFVITYNGEIYNYRELRLALSKRGASFRTQSDTEVVIEAYKAFGPAFFESLEGMFAFGLWDREKRQLLLARDRAGEKPLYYARLPNCGVAFASELSALRLLEAVPSTPDAGALLHFIRFGYMPSRQTVLASVSKLEPAHCIFWDAQGPHEPVRYWDIKPFLLNKRTYTSLDEAASKLRELIDRAVDRQRIADVDVAVLLSGGVDSSTVAASLREAGNAVETVAVSMGFAVAGFDETSEARTVAHHLGFKHEVQTLAQPTDQDIFTIFGHQSEPLADTSYLPTWHLSRLTRNFAKVALGGDGADELFGGYKTYAADSLSQWIPRFGPEWRLAASAIDALPHRRDKVGADFMLRQFARGLAERWPACHAAWRQFIYLERALLLLHPDLRQTAIDSYEDPARFATEVADAHYADQSFYIDVCTWLPNDILTKVDRASMAHGLEVRSPFLDRAIMEFAASLPPTYRRQMFQGKRVLKRSQADRLPAGIVSRGKRGFNAPFAVWLGKTGRHLDDVFEAPPGDDPFDQSLVAAVWREHREGIRDHHLVLLAILAYRLWQAQGREHR